jgi:peptidoglycan LD-endopeptidase LytH
MVSNMILEKTSVPARGLFLSIAASFMSGQLAWAAPEGMLKTAPANPQKATAAAGEKAKAQSEPEKTLSEAEKKSALAALKSLHLRTPIEGFDLQRIKGAFYEKRGEEIHHAADLLAERNTPVFAVADGKIAKLFLSKAGGITIYQFDPSERFVFYYAHLEKYAEGLAEGKSIKRGELIGYVCTSGNAPKNTPHLHFSVGVMDQSKKWWQAIEVDPFEVLTDK